MRSLITPYITRHWSSDSYRRKRQIKAQKLPDADIAQVFIALDDPYSYLLLKGLLKIQLQNTIQFNIHIIQNRQANMFPEANMWQAWAQQDAQLLGGLYEIPIPKLTSDPKQQLALTSQFMELDASSIALALTLFEQDEIPAISSDKVEKSKLYLERNEEKLLQLGHYLPATVYYMGEFFWGLDRLSHFEAVLMETNKQTDQHQGVLFDRTFKDFCQTSPDSITDHQTPLVLYFSMRSPYSHLALNRCYQLCQHYDIPLEIKPVLPMLMRGLPVPKNKTQYIFFDTLREAKKLGVEYGNVADPIGQGVRNCYAIWMLAKEKGIGNEFMLCFSNAVNAKGLSGNYRFGLKRICKEVGLDWNLAKKALNDPSVKEQWEQLVENNLKEMYRQGMWGVPTLNYGDTWVWGQDRIWKIEQKIINRKHETSKAHS